MNITIRRDESITIIGRKGSGKTHMMNSLIDATLPPIQSKHRYIILDTKQVGDYTRFVHVTKLKDLPQATEQYSCVVFAPSRTDARNPNVIEAFLNFAYERWNTTVIIDELSSIIEGNNTPDSYKDITDRGRAKHVTIWQGNQKPVHIPHAALSEADHYFIFDLMVDTAREKLANIIGKSAKIRSVHASGGDVYAYWYYHTSMESPVIMPGIGGKLHTERR